MKASGNGSNVTGQRKKGLSFEKCCVRIAIEFDADHGHQKQEKAMNVSVEHYTF